MQQILAAFNSGQLDAHTAAERLMISRTRLYELRHQWLTHQDSFTLQPSDGDHAPDWPQGIRDFLAAFLPHFQPLNFALFSDELARRFDFHRSRAAVAAYVRQHFSPRSSPAQNAAPNPERIEVCGPGRTLAARQLAPSLGGPADSYPTLLLTLDDHSRKILAATFAPSNTTWSHFVHLRSAIEAHGLPTCLYTDGLSLFGHRCPADRLDTHSQFQRAFTALGVAHRVAPDAQAKGKIERRFDTFQKRLVTLLAYEKISDYPNANALLQVQIAWHNQHQQCRTTGSTPMRPGNWLSKKSARDSVPCPLCRYWTCTWPSITSVGSTPITPWTFQAKAGESLPRLGKS